MTPLFRYHIPSGFLGVPLTGVSPDHPLLVMESKTDLAPSDFDTIRHDFSPLVITLGLLGYDVSAIEVLRPVNALQLKMNAQGDISYIMRTGVEPYEYQKVRLYLASRQSGLGQPAIQITEADVDSYLAKFGSWYDVDKGNLYHRFNPAHQSFVQERDAAYSETLRDAVRRNLMAFVDAGFEGTITLDSGLIAPGVAADFMDGVGWRAVNMIKTLIIPPVTAFLQHQLGKAAVAWFAPTDEDPDPRLGSLPPGRLAVLDPENWRDGSAIKRIHGNNFIDADFVQKAIRKIKKSYGFIAQAMHDDTWVVEPSLYAGTGRVQEKPGYQYYVAGLSSHRCDLTHTVLPDTALEPVHASSVIVQRLAESMFDLEIIVGEPDAATGLDKAYGGSQRARRKERDPDCVTSTPTLTHMLRLSRQLDRSQFVSFPANRSHTTGKTVQKLADELRLGVSDMLENYVESSSAFLAFLMMVEFRIFDISHLTGYGIDDADVWAEEYDVVATQMPDGGIRLTLPDYDFDGVELHMIGEGLGYSLREAVCWSWIPKPEPQPVPATEATRQKLHPSGYADRARIVIVAAPGVQINRKGIPSHIEVDVIRVQSIARVPPPGSRIDPLFYSQTRTVSLDEVLTDLDRAEDPGLAGLVDDVVSSGNVPNVVIKPINVPVRIPPFDEQAGNLVRQTGVEINLPSQEQPDIHWHSALYGSRVLLLVNAESGSQAFSYSFRLDKTSERRAATLNSTIFSIDIVRFELIVHSTHDFPALSGSGDFGFISHADPWLESHDSVDGIKCKFWRAYDPAVGADDSENFRFVRDIAPQGTQLEQNDDGDPIVQTWYENQPDGSLVRRESAPLQWRSYSFNPYLDTYVWLAQMVWDVGTGFIPIYGDVQDLAEFGLSFYTGTDKWGQPVSHLDRALMAGGVLIPFVSSRVLLSVKNLAPADTAAGFMEHVDN
jgi:hypothetical protein